MAYEVINGALSKETDWDAVQEAEVTCKSPHDVFFLVQLWSSSGHGQGHNLIRVPEASIACGGVFQRNAPRLRYAYMHVYLRCVAFMFCWPLLQPRLSRTFGLVLHMLVKFDLDQPLGPVLKVAWLCTKILNTATLHIGIQHVIASGAQEAFLLLNKQRGLVVAGTIKLGHVKNKPGCNVVSNEACAATTS